MQKQLGRDISNFEFANDVDVYFTDDSEIRLGKNEKFC